MKTLYLSFFMLILVSASGQTFEWAVKAGGNQLDVARAITIDDLGNIYHVGEFRNICDFDPGPGTFNLMVPGSFITASDGYICKLNNNGNLIWAKQLTGTGNDNIHDIVLDHDNNLLVSGMFGDSADFDLGAGTNIIADMGGFVAKYDSAGNLIWVNRFDFSGNDEVKIDNDNNIIISAAFSGTIDCDPGPGVFNLSGLNDVVIIKLTSSGNFIWAKSLISALTLSIIELIPANNSIYLCGAFAGTMDVDPGPGVYNLMNSGALDGYVARYDTAGNFIWAFSLSSSGNDWAEAMYTDASGNIVVAGVYSDTIDFDPGPGIYNLVPVNQVNVFILKVDSAENFNWAKSFDISPSAAMALSHDNNDEICLTSDFYTTADFDPGPGVVNLTSAGAADVFLLKLNSTGDFQWVRTMGAIGQDRAYDIVVDSLNNIYSCGVFNGTVDFNPPNMVNLVSSGMFDIFVTKFSQTPLGINETSVTDSPIIFPNPNSGKFHIILPENEKLESVNITDMMGRLVEASVIGENSEYEVIMDVQPGIYCARIYTENKNYVTVLVRE